MLRDWFGFSGWPTFWFGRVGDFHFFSLPLLVQYWNAETRSEVAP